MVKKRILFYSHDTFGLGHIRRTQKIANRLANKDTAIVVICSSPKTNDFSSKNGIEYLKLPGFTKLHTGDYVARNLNIEIEEFIKIRSELILSMVKSFKPDAFIVDKEPLGVKGELLPALEYLKNETPECYCICGLRDILDSPEKVKSEWRKRGSQQALRKYYSSILVYGDKRVYDLGREYSLSTDIEQKLSYVGYLFQGDGPADDIGKKDNILPDLFPQEDKRPQVLFTLGGGEDGDEYLKIYVDALTALPKPAPFKTIIITGPFLSEKNYESMKKKLAPLDNVRFLRFTPYLKPLIQKSDLVVSMGGYNTFCENLSVGKKPLILPRVTPRLEQLIRAKIFKEKGICEYIHPGILNKEVLTKKILDLLKGNSLKTMGFETNGLSITAEFIENVTSKIHVPPPRQKIFFQMERSL